MVERSVGVFADAVRRTHGHYVTLKLSDHVTCSAVQPEPQLGRWMHTSCGRMLTGEGMGDGTVVTPEGVKASGTQEERLEMSNAIQWLVRMGTLPNKDLLYFHPSMTVLLDHNYGRARTIPFVRWQTALLLARHAPPQWLQDPTALGSTMAERHQRVADLCAAASAAQTDEDRLAALRLLVSAVCMFNVNTELTQGVLDGIRAAHLDSLRASDSPMARSVLKMCACAAARLCVAAWMCNGPDPSELLRVFYSAELVTPRLLMIISNARETPLRVLVQVAIDLLHLRTDTAARCVADRLLHFMSQQTHRFVGVDGATHTWLMSHDVRGMRSWFSPAVFDRLQRAVREFQSMFTVVSS